MSDLINRQDAINGLYNINPSEDMLFVDAIVDMLENLPSVEPEQKKGRWIENKYMYYYCSECGHEAYWDAGCTCQKLFDFCQNCGTDMRSKE